MPFMLLPLVTVTRREHLARSSRDRRQQERTIVYFDHVYRSDIIRYQSIGLDIDFGKQCHFKINPKEIYCTKHMYSTVVVPHVTAIIPHV